MVSSSKIIAARPRPARRPNNRRGVGRPEATGRRDPADSVRAKYTTTTPGSGKTSPVPTQAAEKIIVSNLPTDVNEAQIKVCSRLLMTCISLCSSAISNRNCFIPPLDLSRTSPFTMIPLVAQRGSPTSCSKKEETGPKLTNSTTTA
jgi:hypothetical protein